MAPSSGVRRELAEALLPRRSTQEDGLPPLLILLTIVTGIVDAVAYLALGHVFVANMTGNVVFVGFAAAGAQGFSAGRSLLAIACFLPGGIAAARLGARLGNDRLRQLRDTTIAQTGLVVAAGIVAALAGSQLGRASSYALIVLLALAMGIQNASSRRLAVADLTTTVLTLTLTGIAADSWLGGGHGARTTRRVLAVAAMLLGAFVGALLLLKVAPVAPLAVAAGLLVVVAVAAGRRTQVEAASTR